MLLAGCQGRFSALDPAGSQARLIADLSWLMFGLAGAVMALVSILLLIALRRARGRPRDSRLNGTALVIGGGVVLPLIVLPILWVVSLQGMAALSAPEQPYALEIDVHGRQFTYDVVYPEHGIRLTDELHVPVGQPVLVRLHADDVIHSFWIPRLSGKTDLIPGVTNQTWIMAPEPGNYEGACSEYCGIGHFEMTLTVVAHEAAEFEAWLAEATP